MPDSVEVEFMETDPYLGEMGQPYRIIDIKDNFWSRVNHR